MTDDVRDIRTPNSPHVLPLVVGAVVTVEIEAPVAGGFSIARHNGQVLFIRGGLPGESVRAKVISIGKRGSFARAQVVSVERSSPERVDPPCPHYGICGGCDWQHASVEYGRELKAQVIREALSRTGGIDHINGLPLDKAIAVRGFEPESGLGWRTRMRFAIDSGTVGLRAARSNTIIPASDCLLPVPAAQPPTKVPGNDDVLITAASSTGQVFCGTPQDASEAADLVEVVRHRRFAVRPDGFWQVHPLAARTLLDLVLEYADPQAGETALDLYSGVGLFSSFLAEIVGILGRVDAVEFDRAAVRLARKNTADLPSLHSHKSDVAKWLRHRRSQADIVVLDPPRAGAGKEVVEHIAAAAPRVIAYVACDPVSFARDAKWLAERGYAIDTLTGLDLFPMTKHVELVARLIPAH